MAFEELKEPKFLPKVEAPARKREPFFGRLGGILLLSILISSVFGFLAGGLSGAYFSQEIKDYLSSLKIEIPEIQPPLPELKEETKKQGLLSQEERIVKVVEEVSPSVVSIVVSKDLPIIEDFFGFPVPGQRMEKREVGGGTGFLVSNDGMILTNKHVVLDKEADYAVLTNDGRQYEAKFLAEDPFQDFAIIKISDSQDFSVVRLGDSSDLRIGQTVIAIGNVLGEFRNSVSVGVISGLGRTITAQGGGFIETLEDVIQTDAAINKGNSGGPLLNLKGEVIGINTATALGAENIGFAIPINYAKKDIAQVKESGQITYPFLGIYYVLITPELKEQFGLPVDYGAWVGRDRLGRETRVAIFEGSAAQAAGLQRDDIILEFDGERISPQNSLAKIIQKRNPGDRVFLKILRGREEKTIEVVLGERKE